MPRNVHIKPINLTCQGCISQTVGEARYEVVIGPPQSRGIVLCPRCVEALRRQAADQVTETRDDAGDVAQAAAG